MIPKTREGRSLIASCVFLVMFTLGALLCGCQMPWSGADRVVSSAACRDFIDSYHSTRESTPAWSPAGDEIVAFASRNPRGELAFGPYLVDLRTGAWKQLAQGSAWRYPQTALWHPRERLVLISYDPGADVLDIEQRTLRTLTDASGQAIYRARWSPAGDSVWYSRTGGLHVMAVAGGAARLAIPSSSAFRPVGRWAFSPDGRTIAYANTIVEADGVSRGRAEIMLIDPDGRNPRRITSLDGNARNPIWIHGGREILFDWADTLCVNRVNTPDRYWFAVDVLTGRVRQLGQYLGSPQYQFSFPIGVDFAGERAAVVGNGGARKTDWGPGVLFTTIIERDTRERLLRPGSPEMP